MRLRTKEEAIGVMIDDDHLLPNLQGKVDMAGLIADFPILQRSGQEAPVIQPMSDSSES